MEPKNKKQACKPGSVVFYHLSCSVVAGGIQRPTPRHRTNSPTATVYMALQPMMRTASGVTAEPVGSYPAFSPLPARRPAVIFCCAHTPRGAFPLGSMVSCVARTFLSNAAIERPALKDANKTVKVSGLLQKTKYSNNKKQPD